MSRGAGLFWAALLAFVLVDVALLALPRVAALVGPARAATLFAYLLLAACALAAGWLATAVASALRERRRPRGADLVRGLVLLALLGGHVALLLRARG